MNKRKINAIKFHVFNLTDKKDYGICDSALSAQNALNELANFFLGEDFYVCMPEGVEQVNTAIVYEIECNYINLCNKKYRKKILDEGDEYRINKKENKNNKELNKKLINAAYDGDIETAKRCIYDGANIHVMDDLPFAMACSTGQTEMVKLLLDHGVKYHIDSVGLRMASENGHTETVIFLYNYLYTKNY